MNNKDNKNKVENTNENKKKNKLVAWWLNLKKPAKIAICAGGAVALASAIVFPTLAATVWNNKGTEEINPELFDEVQYFQQLNLVSGKKYTMTVDSSKIKEDYRYKNFTLVVLNDNNNIFTLNYIDKVTFKTNLHSFKKTADNTVELGQYEYCYSYQEDDESLVCIGNNSSSDNEKEVTCSFTCKKSLSKAKVGLVWKA